MSKYRFCPSCGEQLIPNSRFCHNCGSNLNTEQAYHEAEITHEENIETVRIETPQEVLDEQTTEILNLELSSIYENQNEPASKNLEETTDEELEEDYEDDGLGVFGKFLIGLIVVLIIILLGLGVFFLKTKGFLDNLNFWPFKSQQVQTTKTDESKTSVVETPKVTVENKQLSSLKDAIETYTTKNNQTVSDIKEVKIDGLKVSFNNQTPLEVSSISLSDLTVLNNLNSLTISNTNLENLNGLNQLSNLNSLTLENNGNLKDAKAVLELKNLNSVKILNTPIYDYRSFKDVKNVMFDQSKNRDSKARQVEVITDNLRIRKEASENASEAGTKTKKGDFYYILDEKSTDKYKWLKIGNDAWIASVDNEWTKIHE